MPIPYASLAFDIRAALDAEGSDYYRDDLDLVPAINDAQQYLMSIILPKFGSKKFSAESMRGLVKTRIFQPSIYSRIYVDSAIDTWGLISVYVNPVIAIPPAPFSTFIPQTVPTPDTSIMLPNYIYVSGGKSAQRLTSQEWTSNAGNPFLGGYVPRPNETPALNLNYGYLSHIDNESAINAAIPYEITIRPYITSTTPVAITFASLPTPLTGTGAGQNLDWNSQFNLLLKMAALKFLSIKQGDKTDLYDISEKDVDALVMLNP